MKGVAPRFDVITLFPDKMLDVATLGVIGRANKNALFELKCWNPRDFTTDPHRTVDDRPYGGGPGMLMLAEPLYKTLSEVRRDRGFENPFSNEAVAEAPLVYMTPHGPLLNQQAVSTIGNTHPQGCIFLCGRYEGVDQRFIDAYVNQTFCLGDFVLSGGELPVACFIDAWVRLLPGVLNSTESAPQDSFQSGLLDCAHYTRPEVFQNMQVPDVLLSGNHAKIADWRLDSQIEYTKRYRPELLISSSGDAGQSDD